MLDDDAFWVQLPRRRLAAAVIPPRRPTADRVEAQLAVLAEAREALLVAARETLQAVARETLPAVAREALPAEARETLPAEAREALPAEVAVAGLPTPVRMHHPTTPP